MSAPLKWIVFSLVLLALCAGAALAAYRLAGGGSSGDRAAELREAEADFDAHAVPGDPDAVPYEKLLAHRALAVRISPPASRPPAPYRLLRSGDYYDVWRRPAQPEGRPVLYHMALGSGGAVAAVPNCSYVNGLGFLALSGQMGLAGQDIAIVAAGPGGRLAYVPPSEAGRRLCGRRWDWIEAVGRGG